jgi:hypothetical protein
MESAGFDRHPKEYRSAAALEARAHGALKAPGNDPVRR